jgi:tyrosinase
MRLNTPVALCLLAGALSNALPAASPQDDTTTDLPTTASSDVNEAADQLEQLAAYAQEQVNSTLSSNGNEARGGKCTLTNLAVRREWYVKISPELY